MWTLRIELLCSALLPLLHVLFRNASRGMTILGFLLLALLPVAGLSPRSFGPMFMFFLGYVLSGTRQWDWGALVGRIRWGWIPVWIGLLALTKLARLRSMPVPVVGMASVMEGLCAALVVARIAHGADGPWLRVLDHRFSNLLGKLSYSFYLVHFPLLFFLLEPVWSHLPSRFPPGMAVVAGFITWAVSTAVALPASWVLYRVVEMPCIEIGRYLGRFEKRRRPPVAAA